MSERPQVVRRAEPHDAEAIARCHVRSWQAAYRGQVPDRYLDALPSEIERRTAFWERAIRERSSRRQHQLVVVEGDRVVGFATYGPQEPPDDPAVGELYAIYLDPDHWDHGHGRALMHAAERGLSEDGYAAATLWVLGSNARARRFYEIGGWAADGGTKVERRGDVELREVRYRRDLRSLPR